MDGERTDAIEQGVRYTLEDISSREEFAPYLHPDNIVTLRQTLSECPQESLLPKIMEAAELKLADVVAQRDRNHYPYPPQINEDPTLRRWLKAIDALAQNAAQAVNDYKHKHGDLKGIPWYAIYTTIERSIEKNDANITKYLFNYPDVGIKAAGKGYKPIVAEGGVAPRVRRLPLNPEDFSDDPELQQLILNHRTLLDAAILEAASYKKVHEPHFSWPDKTEFPDENKYIYDDFARELTFDKEAA
jgi:hypothetical protein